MVAQKKANLRFIKYWLTSFLLFCLLFSGDPGQAQRQEGNIHERIVRSKEDAERLKGFQDHLKSHDKVEEQRLKGLSDFLKKKKQEENAAEERRLDFIKNRKKTVIVDKEATPEYKEDRKVRLERLRKLDQQRSSYVTERDERWRKESLKITLSEAEELGVPDKRPRVEIAKRHFILKPGAGASGSSRGGGSSGGSYSPPPLPEPDFPAPDFGPPPPPPPEFFEPEFPPPPPMPGFPGDGFDGSDFPPPPGFEEPPPYFDTPDFIQ